MLNQSLHPQNEDLFVSGHRACHGCGQAIAVRHILKATGKDVIVVVPTGCLETFTLTYDFSSWRVPCIHHLFENAPAVASGVAAALAAKNKQHIRVLVIGGDGATFDIGFGSLSGMLERGDDVLYICMDNGAYMNTGGQRSGATMTYAATTTHPPGKVSMGKPENKKDLPAIIAAHGVPYVATASVAYLGDLRRKVKKAMTYRGPRYIQIDTPCPSIWGYPPEHTLEIGRLGFRSGLVPIIEMEDGKLKKVRKIDNKIDVIAYLKTQKRFRHLIDNDDACEERDRIKAIADSNMARYALCNCETGQG
ncbi:MAG: pyruvate ferredoxin oxidoreductase [Deltaproteobacteria bacterium]|nr:pyruvate ferredoxin oxidoreductase [Deltaproteobacteria bacterium]